MACMDPFQVKGRPGWYIKYRDHARTGGPWRVVKGGDTYKAAVIELHRREQRSGQIRDGIVTQQQLRDADRMKQPVSTLLVEWRASLESRGVNQAVVDRWVRYCELITQDRMPPKQNGGTRKGIEAGPSGGRSIYCLAELDPNAVDRYLGRLTATPYSRGVRTRNEYLTAIKAFIGWVRGTTNAGPLDCLHKLNPKRDPRVPRRALTLDEFHAFLDALPDTGRGRDWYRAFYLVAGRCGGRWSEIRRLRVEHVLRGMIHFDASITKTGESGDVEMLPEVEAAVRKILPASGLVFGASPTRRTFERHLARAGIAYRLDGRVVSLRKTLASQLIAAGAKPAELKLVMRHRSITTTFAHYNDPALVDTAGAMARLVAKGATNAHQEPTDVRATHGTTGRDNKNTA